MKANEIQKKVEGLIDDEMIKVIAKKIISELDNNNYFGPRRGDDEPVCAGIIYIAYIKGGIPKSIDLIGELFSYYERRLLNKEIKNIKKSLGMKYCKKQTMMGTSCIVLSNPEEAFIDLCKKENASSKIVSIGKGIIKKIENNPLFSSYSYIHISGIVYYISSSLEGVKISQRDIGYKISATEVTVRNIMHKILASDKDLEKKFKESQEWNNRSKF